MLVVCLLAFSAIILLLGCVYSYRVCFYSPHDRSEDPYRPMEGSQYEEAGKLIFACTQVMDEAPFQWIQTTSFDGLTLYARYYHHRDGAPVILMFHGYRSMALRDCAGGFNMANRIGFNVIAVDQRGHGRSEGNTISFGVLERMDCHSWIQYAINRFGSDQIILLSGLSMGAATVLMALDQPLAKNVVCVMADCPYSSPEKIIREVCVRDRHYPAWLVMPFVRIGARLFGKFSLGISNAVDAVKAAQIPILLIHGEDDRFVPCDMSREIAAANPNHIRLETFPNAGHGLCYMSDPVRYQHITGEFLRSIEPLRPWLAQASQGDEQT